MSYFYLGIIILGVFTIAYYLVFLGLFIYWHDRKTSIVIPPLIFAFRFFLAGFLIVSAISLLLENLPQLISNLPR